jgi:hypothetical protein
LKITRSTFSASEDPLQTLSVPEEFLGGNLVHLVPNVSIEGGLSRILTSHGECGIALLSSMTIVNWTWDVGLARAFDHGSE